MTASEFAKLNISKGDQFLREHESYGLVHGIFDSYNSKTDFFVFTPFGDKQRTEALSQIIKITKYEGT